MIQEILALIVFLVAVTYSLYNFVHLFIPVKDDNKAGACHGCSGSCHLPPAKRLN